MSRPSPWTVLSHCRPPRRLRCRRGRETLFSPSILLNGCRFGNTRAILRRTGYLVSYGGRSIKRRSTHPNEKPLLPRVQTRNHRSKSSDVPASTVGNIMPLAFSEKAPLVAAGAASDGAALAAASVASAAATADESVLSVLFCKRSSQYEGKLEINRGSAL